MSKFKEPTHNGEFEKMNSLSINTSKIDSISLGNIVQIREQLLNQQKEGKQIYRFESGDPSFDIPMSVQQAIQKAMFNSKTHYVSNNGIVELRKELVTKLSVKNGMVFYNEDDIFITNGAMHALYLTFQCLLNDGEEVILPCPVWTEICENVKLAGGKPVFYQLKKESGFSINPEEIEKLINPKTKAIFINSPHNPTGSIASKEQLKQIVEIAQRYGVWLISDEAYEDLVYEGIHHSLGNYTITNKIISIYSFSKSYAMSGLRVGYIVTDDKLMKERIEKLLRCTINGVNSLAQWGALAAIRDDKLYITSRVEEYKKRRDIMFNSLKSIKGLNPHYPAGAFYIWCDNERCENVAQILLENGIGCVDAQSFYSNTNSIRFSFSCDIKMVIDGCAQIKKILGY
ncbi:MAG TPA: pyridoxal phosphate-dependent aminotransferase [Candidatus Sulfopaludibacter sp.]|nr:pyridoxal phosphate-dependent aminotransferase [Candidatus Sulfopaludibacter sp.]